MFYPNVLSNVCLQLLYNFLVDLWACWTFICCWRDGWASWSISDGAIIFGKLVWHRILSTLLFDHLLADLLRGLLHGTKLIIIFVSLKRRLTRYVFRLKRSDLYVVQDWSSDVFFHYFLSRFTVVFQRRNHMMLTLALVLFSSFICSLNHFGFDVFKFEINYHVNRNIDILQNDHWI